MSSLRHQDQNNRFSSQHHVVLTGATGVLGAYILFDLLANTSATVTCLLRGRSEEDARNRVLSFLRVYDPKGTTLSAFSQRVSTVVGDVASPRFGLNRQTYQEITARCDALIHAAASTNLFSKFYAIRDINVGGAEHAIQFALDTPSKYLLYVSTYTVMGDRTFDTSFVFKEDHYDIGQAFPHMAYQESKFIAEGLVREATKQGLVWNIFRPGQIYGDSQTGLYPQNKTSVGGLFYDIFKTTVETGLAGESYIHFDITPVNYVAQGIRLLGLERPHYFETYHLTNPDIKRYRDIMNLIGRCGFPVELIPMDAYGIRVKERDIQTRNGQPYTSSFLRGLRFWVNRDINLSRSATTDATYTANCLRSQGLVCPLIDERLIGTYLRTGVAEGYFPSLEALDAPKKWVASGA